MATTTAPSLQLSPLPAATGRAGLTGAIRSEFTKLRSVRSTYWTLLALVVLSIGLGAAISAGAAADLNAHPGDKSGFDATAVSLFVFFEFGQLIIAVLGALAITSEYSTGMIRTSLTAMPRRGVVYAAKAIVFTGVTLVTTMVTAFVAFFVGQAIMSGTGVSAAISQPNVLRAIIGSALFVTVVALFSFGIGAILRHTAGTITTVIGILFVVPIIVQLLPDTLRWDIMRFFPDAVTRVIASTTGDTNPHLWSVWPQFLVTVAYTVAVLAVGGFLFRKRDA